jgi:hypothetical protein
MSSKIAGTTTLGKRMFVLKWALGVMILIALTGLNMGAGCEQCSDDCLFAGDAECDDGGSGSVTNLCGFGTDCTDCGVRREKIPDIRDFLPVSQVDEQVEDQQVQ